MPLVFGAGAELTGRISALWADIGRASLPLRTICLLHALRVRHALPNAIDLSRGVGATSFVLLAAADVEREATLHGVGPAPPFAGAGTAEPGTTTTLVKLPIPHPGDGWQGGARRRRRQARSIRGTARGLRADSKFKRPFTFAPHAT